MQIGRNEILIGVAVVVVLLFIAVPLGINQSNKSRRGEVPLLVKAIHDAEVAYNEAFSDEGFVDCEAAPRAMHAVSADPVPWASNRGYDRLSWKPENADAVYGAYKVTVQDDGFVVTGACDIDGDGERAKFEMNTAATEPERTTEKNVY